MFKLFFFIFFLIINCQLFTLLVNAEDERANLIGNLVELIKRRDFENISNESLRKIISLLEPPKAVIEQPKTNYPIVLNTWPFVNATAKAWTNLLMTDDPIEAVLAGCSECEELQCDGTVGMLKHHNYVLCLIYLCFK